MPRRFDCFVIFGAMRTGSNFLEASLNEGDGLTCLGELFNPAFVGREGQQDWNGVSLAQRDADPVDLLRRIIDTADDLPGFRFFADHDPRVFHYVMEDPRVAKITLTRNPLDSYVSRKIAQATGRWRQGNVTKAPETQIEFDLREFRDALGRVTNFHADIQRGLQRSGQTAFHLTYADLRDVEVLTGLRRWLGLDGDQPKVTTRTKAQNPVPMAEKVRNFAEMEAALADLDLFGLHDQPVLEPRRGSNVPTYIAAEAPGLLFLPMHGGPVDEVRDWLAQTGPLETGFTQKTLRKWKRGQPGHRSFTILRHPLARAHRAFCSRILPVDDSTFLAIRNALVQRYGMAAPDQTPGDDWTADQHRAAFLAFLGFLRLNLAGQTSLRVDASWASQVELLRGMADLVAPDLVLREGDLAPLRACASVPDTDPVATDDMPFTLAEIYDDTLETAARTAFPRDYLLHGWGNWPSKTDG